MDWFSPESKIREWRNSLKKGERSRGLRPVWVFYGIIIIFIHVCVNNFLCYTTKPCKRWCGFAKTCYVLVQCSFLINLIKNIINNFRDFCPQKALKIPVWAGLHKVYLVRFYDRSYWSLLSQRQNPMFSVITFSVKTSSWLASFDEWTPHAQRVQWTPPTFHINLLVFIAACFNSRPIWY